ncbi:unnamed protein product [Enterobius vermicularis]|uniref:Homeobox protein abdominal-B n=1 Tax=Enterobius vermicularis TaxID=51028 RepID=A0A0N4USW0_ENTVE|nr:unnamed protein product [Enterobius vermicularis]
MYPSYTSRFEGSSWPNSIAGPSSSHGGTASSSHSSAPSSIDYYQQPSTSNAYYHSVNPSLRLTTPYYGTQQCYGSSAPFNSQAAVAAAAAAAATQCCPTNPSPSSNNSPYNVTSYAQYATRYFHHHQQQQHHHNYAHLPSQNLTTPSSVSSAFLPDSLPWRYSQSEYISKYCKLIIVIFHESHLLL